MSRHTTNHPSALGASNAVPPPQLFLAESEDHDPHSREWLATAKVNAAAQKAYKTATQTSPEGFLQAQVVLQKKRKISELQRELNLRTLFH